MVINGNYCSNSLGTVLINLVYRSWAVINGIFKPNTVTLHSCSIPSCPIPFIFSQMAISLMPDLSLPRLPSVNTKGDCDKIRKIYFHFPRKSLAEIGGKFEKRSLGQILKITLWVFEKEASLSSIFLPFSLFRHLYRDFDPQSVDYYSQRGVS
jgi:hypothetical protein